MHDFIIVPATPIHNQKRKLRYTTRNATNLKQVVDFGDLMEVVDFTGLTQFVIKLHQACWLHQHFGVHALLQR